jgi:hypothetical protein
MEDEFWQMPSASTDKLECYGVPYWVVYNATDGHTGSNPSGHTSGAGGLDSDTYTRWKNYSATYTTVSKSDCIKLMRTAHRKIRFRSPVDIPDFRKGNGDQYRIYAGESVIADFEDLGEAQNENLGRDLAPYQGGRDISEMDGVLTFRRNPIIWVPKLDESGLTGQPTAPIYMLNFAWFYPVFLQGDYMRESEPAPAPHQHNTWQIHVDLTWNVLCTDRRSQAVLATGS